MDLAEQNGAKILFNQRCTRVDVPANTIYIQQEDGSEQTIPCDLLFGADGAFSALRTAMSFTDRTNFSQFYIDAGYKELNIPAGPDGTWLIEKNALHIWPRHNYMMIALPNIDGSFTCTLFFPFEGDPSFASLKTEAEVEAFFKAQFPDAIDLMPTLVQDFMHNPVSSLITTKIFPWRNADRSCLIGDAAHAIVPFYGQGMNAGFEDCSVLEALMEQYGEDWTGILAAFEQQRKPNADAVADLALNNFIEMRDKVADPVFLERKKVEKELGRRYAGRFNSVYEMVSFSHTPYAYALHCTRAQDILLGKILAEGDFFSNIEQPAFVNKLEEWLKEYEAMV